MRSDRPKIYQFTRVLYSSGSHVGKKTTSLCFCLENALKK